MTLQLVMAYSILGNGKGRSFELKRWRRNAKGHKLEILKERKLGLNLKFHVPSSNYSNYFQKVIAIGYEFASIKDNVKGEMGWKIKK